MEDAERTLEKMRESGFKINFFALDSFLTFYAEQGDIENIEKTIKKFAKHNVPLHDKNLFNVMCNLGINEHVEHIDKLLPYLETPLAECGHLIRVSITRLVKHNAVSAIQKMLTLSSTNVEENAEYLIQEMIRLNVPIEVFNQVIDTLASFDITIENNFSTFKPAIAGPSVELILKILEHMKLQSMTINENHFSKLLQLTVGNEQLLLKTIKLMCTKFEVQPQITFIRDEILPKFDNRMEILNDLKSTGIKGTTIALVNHLISEDELSTAFEIANKHSLYYGTDIIVRPLLRVYKTTNDLVNFCKLTKLVYDSMWHIKKYNKESSSVDGIALKQRQFIDETLKQALAQHRLGKKPIERLLEMFIEEEVPLSVKQANEYSLFVTEKELNLRLMKLTSVSKTNRDIKSEKSSELEKSLQTMQADDNDMVSTARRLLYSYLTERKTAKVKSLVVSGKLQLNAKDFAKLISYYVATRDVESALDTLKQIQRKDESFKLDVVKVAQLISLMIDLDRDSSEFESILLSNKPKSTPKRVITFERTIKKLIVSGKSELAEKLFESFVNLNYIKVTLNSVRPFVSAHLSKNDLQKAVEAYKYVHQVHNHCPMTTVLMRRLITEKRLNLLNSIYGIYRNRYGNAEAATRLAFAYLECGYERQAKFILEDKQIQKFPEQLTKMCDEYDQRMADMVVKSLLNVTQGMFMDYRNVIYETLLNIYCKKNQVEDALKLWDEYEAENNIQPSNTFRMRLIDLLKVNKCDVSPDIEID